MKCNIYSATEYVEDRPLKNCENCRKLKRLNILQYSDGIVAYVCDKCVGA